MDDGVAYCLSRIVEEEAKACGAPSREAGEAHFQLVMLYKAQLAALTRLWAMH